MHKVAVIGEKESVIGFAALGLDVFEIDDATGAEKKIKELLKLEYGIIYLTEKVAQNLNERLDYYQASYNTAIVPIPGSNKNAKIGLENVRKSIERAVGSNILEI